ncbi:hypothetical protein EW146_g1805 [Bondarzewia mesenterica]|uniref:endo-polygalacturonase n=1 Tax=Bondarzewia mesenterica TaxID=1095465 RepID=A0A4S4M2N1_9AGAM|nr:hypothetical protein EW146_g1805 [Bondarzewia mesenterica]
MLGIALAFSAVAVHSVLGAVQGADCTGTISSLDDVDGAVACTTVNINSFTVPAGETFNLELADGTTVNMRMPISLYEFCLVHSYLPTDEPQRVMSALATRLGPVHSFKSGYYGAMVTLRSGTSITFNGNGHTFNGNGPFYWDGLGGNGGVTKPAPMMKIKISGVFTNVKVLNSPERVYSVSNPAPLVMSNLVIDDSLGDEPNAASNGEAAGHNTDGFDCSTNDLTIESRYVLFLSIFIVVSMKSHAGTARYITKTIALPSTRAPTSSSLVTLALAVMASLSYGTPSSSMHRIQFNAHSTDFKGSISSDAIVSGIIISDNTITNNDQALRIKTKADATDASVSNVTYIGNIGTGMRQFGVLIDQSYPDTLGTPGTGVIISNINFSGSTTSITVNNDAQRVAVNCGSGACTGTWDWSSLQISGGSSGPITGFSGITNFSQ